MCVCANCEMPPRIPSVHRAQWREGVRVRGLMDGWVEGRASGGRAMGVSASARAHRACHHPRGAPNTQQAHPRPPFPHKLPLASPHPHTNPHASEPHTTRRSQPHRNLPAHPWLGLQLRFAFLITSPSQGRGREAQGWWAVRQTHPHKTTPPPSTPRTPPGPPYTHHAPTFPLHTCRIQRPRPHTTLPSSCVSSTFEFSLFPLSWLRIPFHSWMCGL